MEAYGLESVPSTVERKGGAEREQQAIEALLSRLSSAFNAHDARQAAQCFALEGTIVDPWGVHVEGREEIQKLLGETLGKTFINARHRFRLLAVRFLGSDLAFIDVAHDAEGASMPGGRVHIHVDGLLKKDANEWRMLDARPHAFLQRPVS